MLTKEQERQIRGGRIVFEKTGGFNANAGECILKSIDYLSEANYDEIYESYLNKRVEEMDRPYDRYTRENAIADITEKGINRDYLNILYNEFVLGSDTGLVAEQYSVDDKDKEYGASGDALLEQLAQNPNGTPGSLMSGSAVTLGNGQTIYDAMPNMGHNIVITNYDEETQTVFFWDEGNESAGTCHISDLDCFTTVISGSTDNL